MIAGDSNRKNFTLPIPDPPRSSWGPDDRTQDALAQKAIGFNCLNYTANPEGALERHFLPNKSFIDAECKDGVRLELMFPSCWDGKRIDSADHKSHMSYPDLVMEGTCPATYQSRLPALYYETIWNTSVYMGVDGEFLLSNGDQTGYGFHGDFFNGWDIRTLQQGIETCTTLSGLVEDCTIFQLQTTLNASKCILSTPVELQGEDCIGPQMGMCGGITT